MIHNELRAYVHQLEVLAENLAEYLSIEADNSPPLEEQLRKLLHGRLNRSLERVKSSKQDLAYSLREEES